MARQETAGTIINRAAREMALTSADVSDPFSTTNEAMSTLAGLLNAAGQELATLFEWQTITEEFTFNTTSDVTDQYVDLPDDFDRFIEQTGWDLNNDVPLIGPLSAQQWAYLQGRDLAANTIYVAYRQNSDKMQIYPDPPPSNHDISIRYISRNWAQQSDGTRIDFCTTNSDIVRLDPLLMQKFVKVKYLEAKNLPSQAAALQFENMLNARTGSDKGAQVLSAAGQIGYFPYINPLLNTPDTGFGP